VPQELHSHSAVIFSSCVVGVLLYKRSSGIGETIVAVFKAGGKSRHAIFLVVASGRAEVVIDASFRILNRNGKWSGCVSQLSSTGLKARLGNVSVEVEGRRHTHEGVVVRPSLTGQNAVILTVGVTKAERSVQEVALYINLYTTGVLGSKTDAALIG